MKNKKIIFLISILSILISSCSPVSENEDLNKDDEEEIINPDDSSTTYTYSEPKTYEGVFTSQISYDLLSSLGVDVDIFSSYINFTFQEANEEIKEGDYLKAFKFHLNLDLYSIEESYESSIVSSSLIPLIFSDFKYQKILSNVTDLDMYYFADGNLYATISRFEGDKNPSRNDLTALKSLPREIIGTTKIDISSILEMLESSDGSSSISFETIFSTLGSFLNGLTIDFSTISDIINSTKLSFVNDGYIINFKEEGLNAFSLIFNNLASYLLNSLDLGISIDQNEPLINVSNVEIEANPLEIKAIFEDEASLKPLFYLYLTRNDNSSLIVEPPFNLEEDYLFQKNAVNMINFLYSLYDNYPFDSSYDIEIMNVINSINLFDEERRKRVENFNNYLGYELLNTDTNGLYTSLKEKENLDSLYEEFLEIINNKIDDDESFIKLYKLINKINTSKYSTNIKNNLLKAITKNNETRFNEFKEEILNYLNKFIDPIYNNINNLFAEFNSLENITLKDKHDLIENIYLNSVKENIVLTNEKIIDLDDYKNEEIKELPTYIINEVLSYLSLGTKLENNEFVQQISNNLLSYFNELTLTFNKITDKELTSFNDYASYLIVDENKDDLYEIFNLISKKSSDYYETLKRKNDELINLLISTVDKFANERIDSSLKKEDIYYILNIEKLNDKKEELEGIFNMLNHYLSNSLYQNYSFLFTYIDKYYSLIDMINNQIANLS